MVVLAKTRMPNKSWEVSAGRDWSLFDLQPRGDRLDRDSKVAGMRYLHYDVRPK